MKQRIAATAVFGLLLGAWAYLDFWSYEDHYSLHATLHGPVVVPILLALAILVGAIVGRGWVVLALAGPVISLAYLEQTSGHRGPDGISPLSSAPSIFFLVLFGLMLLAGVGVSHLWRQLRDQRQHRET